MTVEETIFDALKGLVGDRVYADVAVGIVPRPYITYQQVGGEGINFADPTIPSKKNGRFQINVWADTRAAAAALARQVEDILRVTTALQTTVLGAQIATYEPDTKLYGTLQDYSFWF